MQDLKAYKKCREDLLWDILGAAGLVASLLPAEARPGSELARAGGSQWNNHDLKSVADKLQDVLYRFDQVQHTLGLWEHDARFGHPPAGSTNPQTEETPPMTAKKSPPKPGKPKSALAPSKKPEAIDGKPKKHRGSTGYSDNRHG